MVTLKQLTAYAMRKSRPITKKPIKVVTRNLPHTKKYDVNARSYDNVYHPYDKSKPSRVVSHEIALDRRYYKSNQNNPNELRQAVLHEICHCKHPNTHGEKFQRCARKIGADKKHQKAYWN
jgi:hypothetical protein